MSNKQHVQKKNLKVSKNVLRKEVDKLRDNWINAGPGVPGAPPRGNHLGSLVVCVYLSAIVAAFGPLRGPRRRDSVASTAWRLDDAPTT